MATVLLITNTCRDVGEPRRVVPSPPSYPAYIAIQAGVSYTLPVTMGSPTNWVPVPQGIARFDLDAKHSALTITGLQRGFGQWDPAVPGHHPVWVAVLNQPRSAPVLVAHHGLPSEAPENTLAGIRMVCGLSIPGIEVDVRFTADSVPVLIHDRSVARTSNGTGNVDEMTLSQLQQLDFGSWFRSDYVGERIPTLRDFLAVAASCGFDLIQLDVKGFIPVGVDSGWMRIAREVNDANLLSRVQFASSFNELRRAVTLIPGARTVVFVGDVTSALADVIIQYRVDAVGVAFPAYQSSAPQLARLDSLGVSVGVWGPPAVLDLNGLQPVPAFVTSDWRWRFLW